ncbi:hypothetical protein LTR28_005890 [Elasticomyces elasticus]|nr:hypothetical protein LTR28_005890 [Elasticomyces elasticus]
MAVLMLSCSYYLVIYFVAVKQFSPVIAGVALLPLGLSNVPVSGIVGGLISKLGKYQWAIWSGWCIATLGVGVLTILGTDTTTVAFVFMLLCAGVGQGLLLISLNASTQAVSPNKDVAYASCMYAFTRSLGLCLGVALGGTVFQNMLSNRLQHLGLPSEIALDAVGYIPVLRAMVPSSSKRELIGAYAWALRMVFATLTGIGGLGLVLGFTVGRYSLDKTLDSEHVLKEAETSVESSA